MSSSAIQTLIVSKTGKESIRRSAVCPNEKHQRQTSNFLGVVDGGWEFRCPDGHNFIAKADPGAPKTSEDVARWMDTQRRMHAEIGSNPDSQ